MSYPEDNLAVGVCVVVIDIAAACPLASALILGYSVVLLAERNGPDRTRRKSRSDAAHEHRCCSPMNTDTARCEGGAPFRITSPTVAAAHITSLIAALHRHARHAVSLMFLHRRSEMAHICAKAKFSQSGTWRLRGDCGGRFERTPRDRGATAPDDSRSGDLIRFAMAQKWDLRPTMQYQQVEVDLTFFLGLNGY